MAVSDLSLQKDLITHMDADSTPPDTQLNLLTPHINSLQTQTIILCLYATIAFLRLIQSLGKVERSHWNSLNRMVSIL
jgi:hypothetical protein